MRFLIMGAGAVGSVLGAQLQSAGHEVAFWVRPARRGSRVRRSVQRASGETLQLDAPSFGPGDAAPDVDWVLVCVRAEQLDDALRELATQLGPAHDLAISAVSFDNVAQRARRHGLTGAVLAHGISFGAWREPADPERFRFFPFAMPCMLSAEGERSSLPRARALAEVLTRAGSRTQALRSGRGFTTWMVAVSAPFIAGWDLCDFTLERLARDAEHRRLTARGMAESARAARLTGPLAPLGWLPAWAYALLLRLLPRAIGRQGREVWLHHGPKIREQTRYSLQVALGNAADSGSAAPALQELSRRFERQRALPADATV